MALCKLKILGASLKFHWRRPESFLNLKNWGRLLNLQLTKYLQLLSLPLSKEFLQPEIERSKHDYKYNIIKGSGDDP